MFKKFQFVFAARDCTNYSILINTLRSVSFVFFLLSVSVCESESILIMKER